MTADNFTDAARAEAERRWPYSANPDPTPAEDEDAALSAGFMAGAEWARTYLAAQEPTEEEVTEAALAMCRGDGAGTCWNYDDTVHGGCTDHADDARAALSAARAARRDEEKR